MRPIVAIAIAIAVAGCRDDAPAPPRDPPNETPAAPTPDRSARTWSFDDDEPGRVPASVRIAETNSAGTPATWSVVAREDAPSPPHAFGITQTQNQGQTYNVAFVEDTAVADVDLRVTLLSQSGAADRGGGLVWRARGPDDYYIARWNPIEKNVRFYIVLAGHRSALAKAELELDPTQWHELRVVAQGPRMQCFIDDHPILTIEDTSLTAPGMIGLWTKADAATLFDDLSLSQP